MLFHPLFFHRRPFQGFASDSKRRDLFLHRSGQNTQACLAGASPGFRFMTYLWMNFLPPLPTDFSADPVHSPLLFPLRKTFASVNRIGAGPSRSAVDIRRKGLKFFMSAFQDAFVRFDPPQVAQLLVDVNPLLAAAPFSEKTAVVLARDLSFWPGCALCDINDHGVHPVRRLFAIWKPGAAVILNWTNEPIYALNKIVPIFLDSKTTPDYIRFFLQYVRGRHGRFLIAESVDDIGWKEEPPPSARRAVGKLLHPLRAKGKTPAGDLAFEACVMFRDSLFRTDISVTSEGLVTLSNEQMLIEEMPVLDDATA